MKKNLTNEQKHKFILLHGAANKYTAWETVLNDLRNDKRELLKNTDFYEFVFNGELEKADEIEEPINEKLHIYEARKKFWESQDYFIKIFNEVAWQLVPEFKNIKLSELKSLTIAKKIMKWDLKF